MGRTGHLPEPQRQVVIRDSAGQIIGRVDFGIENVVVECDGKEFHAREQSFAKDRLRWNRLQAEGYWPMVLTSHQIEREPRQTCRLILQTLEQQRAARSAS